VSQPIPFRKGDTVRWAGRRDLFTFIRRGIAYSPSSQKWMTVADEQGTEHEAAITDLYFDGPGWHLWQQVYDEQQAETMAEVTCSCCGAVNYNLRDYSDPEYRARSSARAERLHEAHNMAVKEAGRQTFEERYGVTLYGMKKIERQEVQA